MENIDKLVKDLTTKEAFKVSFSLLKDDSIVFLNEVKYELGLLAVVVKVTLIELFLIFKGVSIEALKKIAKAAKKSGKRIFGITKNFLGKVWKKINGKIPYKIVKKEE